MAPQRDWDLYDRDTIKLAGYCAGVVTQGGSDQTVYINDIRSDELAKEVMFSV